MDIEKTLKSCGLDDKEGKIFLAGLKLGKSTASDIAKVSGLKRTTTYFVLERLIEKGFASLRKTKGATYYSVVGPSIIVSRLKRRQEDFLEIVPELEKIRNEKKSSPKIELFEGVEGIRQIYREAEKYLNKPEGVMYFGSFEHYIDSKDYQDILEIWIRLLKDKKNKSREILDFEESNNLPYLKKVQASNNSYHQIRKTPRKFKFLGNDNLIYGNNVAFFSAQKEIFVVKITSEEISGNLKTLFELAWKCSIKIK